MSYGIKRLLAGLLVIFGSQMALAQAVQNEAEPNGTTATANPVTLTNGVAKVQGNVYPNADEDFYSFTGQAGNRVFVATVTSFSSNNNTDSVIELIDTDGTTVLETDDNDGTFGAGASVIAGRLLINSGTHYVRVRHTSATSQLRGYDLYLAVRSGSPTAETEPNDTFPGQALPVGGYVSGVVNPAADFDFYSLTLAQGDTVAVILDCDPERDGVTFNGRVGAGVFAGSQVLVANDANTVSPNGEAFFMTVGAAGTYGVLIDGGGTAGSPTATYIASIFVIPAPTATVFTYSTTTPAAIPTGPGQVTSSINIPDARRIRRMALAIDLTHTNMPDLDVTLQGPGGNEIHLFTDVGNNTQTTMQLGLSDDAAVPINTFTVMQGMVYQPELAAKLDLWRGRNSQGTWTLVIRDDTAVNGGTLNGWSIIIEEEPALPSPGTGFNYQDIFTTDFESGDAGFTSSGTGNQWARGTPTAVPITTANSGTNCFKTNLTGIYGASSVQDLLSPNINLSGVSGPIFVEWAMNYQIENASFDHAYVEVRVAGQPATAVRLWEWMGATMQASVGNPTTTIQSATGWGLHRARIDSFAGQTIEVLFHFDSDTTVQLCGLAIDDVRVFGAVPAPEIDVQRSSTSIADGEPNHALGNVSTLTGQTFTFTVLNTGGGSLSLPGATPVTISGASAGLTVNVTVQPAGSVAPSGSTTFNVFVQPSSAGAFNFTVNVANNDGDENPYNFTCQGTGFTNAPPVLALGSPTDFTAGSDFDLTVQPGASLAGTNGAVLRVTDATPDPVDATITFSTGPQGATPPAGIVPPANVSGGAGAGFNLTWTGTANATNTPGTYVWNVLLTDGVSNVNRSVRITIANLAPAHVVVAPTTGTGALATPYAATIQIGSTTAINIATVSDGNTGQNVSFVSQSLTASPAGSSATHTFSVSPASGNPVTLVCTPSAAVLADLGDFDYTILVQDDTSPTPVQSTIYVRITIAGTAPSITSTALTTAAVGISYNYQVTATGNPSTFTFSASGLPAWLSISGTGLISGTPAAGDIGTTGTITVTVANGITPNATQNFSITVSAAVAPAITSTAVTTATEGTAYTYTFTLTGNPTPTLSLTTGTLPAWLTLSGNTLSGTPPAGSAATYGPFTFTATNGVTPDATQTFSIVVSAPSSGGGGDDDEGCSTGNGQSWLMLAGLLAALGVALRTRKARA